jgi:hypothetical protein
MSFGSSGGRRSALCVAIALVACSSSRLPTALDVEPDAGTPAASADAAAPQPDGPLYPHDGTVFTLGSVRPSAGPASGGQIVVLRGSGFGPRARVEIGGSPADVLARGADMLEVEVPGGAPGAADVVVRDGAREARLAGGYAYWHFTVEPRSGPTAGGFHLELTTTMAVAALRVSVGEASCAQLESVGERRLRCLVPPVDHPQVADVVLFDADGNVLRADGAFEYLDTALDDHLPPQLQPIDGLLTVHVSDANAQAVASSLVLVERGSMRWVQRTDARGFAVFSDDALRGPVDLHVFEPCSEYRSVIGIDARDVAIELSPRPAAGCVQAAAAPGHATAGALIAGRVRWPAAGWDTLPEPRERERRVIHLATTRARISARNPNPELASMAVILEPRGSGAAGERDSDDAGPSLAFEVFARPGALAVYALAGLEDSSTGEFAPYMMGVTRGVVTAPDQELGGVEVSLDIALDRRLEVAVQPHATLAHATPWRVESVIDLGADGVIYREVNDAALDRVDSATPDGLVLIARPGPTGALGDARVRTIVTAGDEDAGISKAERLHDAGATRLEIDDMLPIPVGQPAQGDTLGEDRTLRWQLDAEVDWQEVELTTSDGEPIWHATLPGDARELTLPDPTRLDEQLDDLPAVPVAWALNALRTASGSSDAHRGDRRISQPVRDRSRARWEMHRAALATRGQ